MKLEVGMYVRTKLGSITKIENEVSLVRYIREIPNVRFSHNIIDLIEVGDVITTNNLCGEVTKIDIENNKIWIACCDYETCRIEDVKSIITREQFESMSYKVGE